VIKIHLPRPISVNALYRNVPGKGRVKTKDYRVWERAAKWEILAQGSPRMSGPYEIEILVRPGREDVPNLEKCVSDVLQSAGVIENDRLCQRLIIAWSDRLRAGVECSVNLQPATKGK
jgi:Holliday junction resolvase RusA-like endonuclease